MKEKKFAINKYASIINRQGNMFFDHEMQAYGLGSGQIFFLLRIAENEGLSVLELASKGFYDKGTTTRAVQKLEEQGFVYRLCDEKDKRIQRLFISENANVIIPKIYLSLRRWNEILLTSLTKEEAEQTLAILQRISENACSFNEKKRREQHERECHK